MAVGFSVREKALATARYWRQLRFKSLRRQLSTPYGGELRLPFTSHEGYKGLLLSTIRLKVETSQEELLRWFQWEYFSFFRNAGKESVEDGQASANVCVHVGPPKSLGYPYTLVSEVNNFTEAVRRGERQAEWEETNSSAAPHSTRWITQSLLDGFVSRRVVAHVGLADSGMPQTLEIARQLNLELNPSDLSPYYFANDLLSSWGMFGISKTNNTEFEHDDISRLIKFAHASVVLPMYRAVWINGAAVCNDKGDAVLILGPRQSGKTTLALHCLSESLPRLSIVGLEDFHLAKASYFINAESNAHVPTVLLMGIPGSAKVGIGALLGTLRSNPVLAESAHSFYLSPSTVQQLVRNNELTIWNMASRYQIHIGEAFGKQRLCPTLHGRLKGIVLLNWDVQELAIPHSHIYSQVLKWEEKEKILGLLTTLAGTRNGSLFKGHYLLRSVYNELNAMELLESSLFDASRAAIPPLYELRGSVSFDTAVQLICKHILTENE